MPTPSATFFHASSLTSHTDEQLPPALASPQGLPSVRVATSPSVRVATSPSATVTSFARPVVAGAAVEGAPSSGNSVIAALAALLALILVCFGAFFLRSRWRAHGGRERTYITPSARGNGPPPPVSSCSATDGRDASSIISANAGQGGAPPSAGSSRNPLSLGSPPHPSAQAVPPARREPECTSCLDRPPNTVMNPCGHMSCEECARDWLARHNSCPTCRTRVISSFRVYM